MKKLLNINAFPLPVRRYGLPVLTLVIFGVLLTITVRYLLRESHVITDRTIVDDVERLGNIFKKIDAQCVIMGFDRQKTEIDFLTVVQFVGSEVGSMNLMRPKKWAGPYVDDNPTVQGKVYEIARTNKGYFIVPGTGVRLNNGKVVGEDIVLDEKADIESMLLDPKTLNFEGRPMAVHIPVSGIAGGHVLDAMVPDEE
jgi:hypothetical protein